VEETKRDSLNIARNGFASNLTSRVQRYLRAPLRTCDHFGVSAGPFEARRTFSFLAFSASKVEPHRRSDGTTHQSS
jgi:hypothetical protein